MDIKKRIDKLNPRKLGRQNTLLELKRINRMESVIMLKYRNYRKEMKEAGIKILNEDRWV